MGYLPIGAGRFGTGWLPRSATVERYRERCSACVEQMILQRARLIPVPWERALLEAVSRLEGTN